jgi:hypothetical protein
LLAGIALLTELFRGWFPIQQVVCIQDSVGITLFGQESLAVGSEVSINSVARNDCVEVS